VLYAIFNAQACEQVGQLYGDCPQHHALVKGQNETMLSWRYVIRSEMPMNISWDNI